MRLDCPDDRSSRPTSTGGGEEVEEDGIWRELKAEEGKLSISSSIILVQNNYKPVVLVALQYLCLES